MPTFLPSIANAQTCPSPDGQCPSRQINSSNTSNDFGSWASISLTTYQPFRFSSPSGGFDFQVNALANGAPPNCLYSCPYAWWLQGFTDFESTYLGLPGVWVTRSGIEEWNAATARDICVLNPSPPNVNFSGYLTQEQFYLVSSTQTKNVLTVKNPTGGIIFSSTTTCSYPGVDTVNYMNRVEGVVVGKSGAEHATFKPLNSEIFKNGVIQMDSNYNHMSSATTYDGQTGESSNLYQTAVSTSTGTSGSLYFYKITLTENTQSST